MRHIARFVVCASSLGLVLACADATAVVSAAPVPVEVTRHEDGFRLLRGGAPYVVKGAGAAASSSFRSVAERGGNSVRTWGIENAERDLDEAARHGLTVALGLPVAAERWGMDYSDPEAVAEQRRRILETVARLANHPALLAWILGNELNHGMQDGARVYAEVNALAQMIRAVDPHHPTTTAITAGEEPIGLVMQHAPDLDFVSIQLYGALALMPRYANEWFRDHPFMVTEWGPLGHWEAGQTTWGAPVEMDSSAKAKRYLEGYRQLIEPHLPGASGASGASGGPCLGSYVFLWGQKQERTPTWYSLFATTGESTAAVDAMQLAWTGHLPPNQAPAVQAMRLNGQKAPESVTLTAGQQYRAEIAAHDPDGDPLTYRWSLKRESTATQEGGDYERPIADIPGLMDSPAKAHTTLHAPPPGSIPIVCLRLRR